ncbi:MAG TPA: pilus assembly protein PilM [Vicinamibacterales bacterium]|jgi:type IV pilus assembly protein PilM|nr:pilus assembly protein PilM [Vicinamibacterales bacterium]
MARSMLSAERPTVAVEIARHRVSAASIHSRDSALVVASHAVEPLPPGVVSPALNAANISDPRAVTEALRRVFDRLGVRPRRIALAIPDTVAKVSLLRFEKVPDRQRDLEELVRWQVRKAVPFRVEDAQLSFVPGITAADGSAEFVVVIARRDIVQEYELACAAAGAQAGIVDLTTFNVINAVLAAPSAPAEDWLLVHVTQEDATMAILRGEHLVFFRNRAGEGESSLADMVHQTAMYYEDRLSGTGFGRVLLAGSGSAAGQGGSDADYLRRALEQRLATKVDQVDPRQAASLTDRITANADLLNTLAPLVGLIVREKAA